MRKKLTEICRMLAKIARLPDDKIDPKARINEAYALRLQVYKSLATLNELQRSSEFESPNSLRIQTAEVTEKLKILFLFLLAIIQHRLELRPDSVSASIRVSSVQFRDSLASHLEGLSFETPLETETQLKHLRIALQRLEEAIAAENDKTVGNDVLAQIHGRFALYEKAIAVAASLT
jgi:vesicle coat complex subunit